MSCKIITVANQKGGTAKTTSAYNLGHALAEQGSKVLLVDFDPQANMTLCYGIENPDEEFPSMSDLLSFIVEGKELPPDRFVYVKVKKERPDYDESSDKIAQAGGSLEIIPSNINLSLAEINLRDEMEREHILSQLLEPLRAHYDYCIIDTSPFLGLLTLNALVACDSVLIPVSANLWSATGLQALMEHIYKIKRRLNPKIEIMGILLTICDERTKIFKEVKELVSGAYGSNIKIFETAIPATVKVQESNYSSKSIIEYDSTNKAAIAYRDFAKEVSNDVKKC